MENLSWSLDWQNSKSHASNVVPSCSILLEIFSPFLLRSRFCFWAVKIYILFILKDERYFPMPWPSFIESCLTRSLRLWAGIASRWAELFSIVLALQEAGELPGRAFQGLSHVTPGNLRCSLFFAYIDHVLPDQGRWQFVRLCAPSGCSILSA